MRGDKRPVLKSSALETCYTGRFTLSTQLIKPDYLHLKKKFGLQHMSKHCIREV